MFDIVSHIINRIFHVNFCSSFIFMTKEEKNMTDAYQNVISTVITKLPYL